MLNSIKSTIYTIIFLIYISSFNISLAFNSIDIKDIYFSTAEDLIIKDKEVRLYINIINNTKKDYIGTIKVFDELENKRVGSDRSFSIVSEDTNKVFVDWKPQKYGEHNIKISILPEGESEYSKRYSIFVDVDSDGDSIPNRLDTDDDNDGIADTYDAFPFDNTEWKDIDNDGIGDNTDTDDDNDGVSDSDERVKGTDPANPDTDNDGMDDRVDQWPLDKDRNKDTDNDGIADFDDNDIDGDNVPNNEDAFPTDPLHSTDTDGDGYADEIDIFPNNEKEWRDSDDDGVGDNEDLFDDNKHPVPIIKTSHSIAINQEFMLDASSSYDTDGEIKKYWWKITCLDENNNCFGLDKKEIEDTRLNWSYTINKKGSYKIKLTVEDNIGERYTEEKIIEVNYLYRKYIAFMTLGGGIMLMFIAFFGVIKRK